MAEITLNSKSLMQNIVVTVKFRGRRRMFFRIWLCSQIFRFGAWVGNVGLKIEDEVTGE